MRQDIFSKANTPDSFLTYCWYVAGSAWRISYMPFRTPSGIANPGSDTARRLASGSVPPVPTVVMAFSSSL